MLVGMLHHRNIHERRADSDEGSTSKGVRSLNEKRMRSVKTAFPAEYTTGGGGGDFNVRMSETRNRRNDARKGMSSSWV